MDATAIGTVAAAGISLVALWRSSRRESGDDQDRRTNELIRLSVGEDIAILKRDLKRILRKLDINGDE